MKCWFCEEKQMYKDTTTGTKIRFSNDGEWGPELKYEDSIEKCIKGEMPIEYCPICGKKLEVTEVPR